MGHGVAAALIMAGAVFSGEKKLAKAGDMLAEDAPLEVRGKDHPWVSRGGIKLDHGLTHFGFDVTAAVALDHVLEIAREHPRSFMAKLAAGIVTRYQHALQNHEGNLSAVERARGPRRLTNASTATVRAPALSGMTSAWATRVRAPSASPRCSKRRSSSARRAQSWWR
jgi:hypothetical protein